jgi:hypothetical protein
MGDMRNANNGLVGRPEGNLPLADRSVCMRIILKWIVEK